jgi:hypothetical protein
MNNARLLPVMVLVGCCVFSAHTMMGKRWWPNIPNNGLADRTIPNILKTTAMTQPEHKTNIEDFLANKGYNKREGVKLEYKLDLLRLDLEEGTDKYCIVTNRVSSRRFFIWSLLSGIVSVITAGTIQHSLSLVPKVAASAFGLLTLGLMRKSYLSYQAETTSIKNAASGLSGKIDCIQEELRKQREAKEKQK